MPVSIMSLVCHTAVMSQMAEETNLKFGQKRVAYSREQHHRNQERDDRLRRHPEESSVYSADG